MLVAPVVEELEHGTPPAPHVPDATIPRCSFNARKGREIGVPVQVVRGPASPVSSRASPVAELTVVSEPPPRGLIAPLPPPPGDLPGTVTNNRTLPLTPVPVQATATSGGFAGLTMPRLTLPTAPIGPPKTLAPPPLLLSPWSPNALPIGFHSPEQHPTHSGMVVTVQPAREPVQAHDERKQQLKHSAASTAELRLADELLETQRHCASLKRKLDAADGAADVHRDETAQLRQQLAAYAADVEVLRSKCSSATQGQQESQSLIQRLSDEVLSSQRRIAELETENSELRMNRQAGREDAQLKLDRVAMEAEDLRQRVAHLEVVGSDLEKERCALTHQLEQEEVQRARLEDELRDLRLCAEASRVEPTAPQTQMPGQAEDVSTWMDVAVDAQRALSTLREHLATQTCEFDSFVSRFKEKHSQAAEELLNAKTEIDQQHTLIEALRRNFCQLQEAHSRSQACWAQQLADEVEVGKRRIAELEAQREAQTRLQTDMLRRDKDWLQERLELERARHRQCMEESQRKEMVQLQRNANRLRKLAQNRVLAGLERALSLNIAKDMRELEKGVVLEKVHEGNCRCEPRLVAVAPDEMMMKWGKELTQLGRNHSRLDLYEVIRIHYGSMARACVLHPDLAPWLCFSLYTPRRSFDFCCPDEAVVRRFVLGLSRLCDWASGAITSRSRFVAALGWCKLEDHCFRQSTTLCRLFLQAIHRVAPSTEPSLVRPPPPPPTGALTRDSASSSLPEAPLLTEAGDSVERAPEDPVCD